MFRIEEKGDGLEENGEKEEGGWPGEPLPPKIEDKHFEASFVSI